MSRKGKRIRLSHKRQGPGFGKVTSGSKLRPCSYTGCEFYAETPNKYCYKHTSLEEPLPSKSSNPSQNNTLILTIFVMGFLSWLIYKNRQQ